MKLEKVYEERARAKLRENQAKIDFLMARAAMMKADLKLGFLHRLQHLKKKLGAAGEKMLEVGTATGETMAEIGKGLESVWEDFRLGFEAAARSIEEGGQEIEEPGATPESQREETREETLRR